MLTCCVNATQPTGVEVGSTTVLVAVPVTVPVATEVAVRVALAVAVRVAVTTGVTLPQTAGIKRSLVPVVMGPPAPLQEYRVNMVLLRCTPTVAEVLPWVTTP